MIIALLTISSVFISCFTEKAVAEPASLYNILLEYPQFKEVMQPGDLKADFRRFVYELPLDDCKKLQKILETPERNIFDYMLLFHEMIEFKRWILLDHKIDDIVDMDYFSKHYKSVWPIGHKEGIFHEYSLVIFYANSLGITDIPVASFAMVNPLIDVEIIGTKALNWLWNIRFPLNPEFNGKCPSIEQLIIASDVYSRGGYYYKNKEQMIKNATLFCEEKGW